MGCVKGGMGGVRKGVMMTHQNIVTNMRQIIAVDFLPPDPVLVNRLPMYHTSGFAFSMNTFAMSDKVVALALSGGFDPTTFLRAIVDHFQPLVGFLANHPAVTDDHLASPSSVRTILVGVALLSTAIMPL